MTIFVDAYEVDGDGFNSRSIYLVGYDRDSKTLYIEFHNSNKVYAYDDVEESTYNLFVEAESLNKFWRTHILGRYSNDVVAKGAEFDVRYDKPHRPEETVASAGPFVSNETGTFNGSTVTYDITAPARYSVKWAPLDGDLTFEPEFFVASEQQAIETLHNRLVAALGEGTPYKVLAVTHHFD